MKYCNSCGNYLKHWSRLKKKNLPSISILLLALLMASWSSVAVSADACKQPKHQVLRFGISNNIPQLITGVDQGTAANTVLTFLHRGLMAYDSDGNLIPAVAESVENPNPTTYVFHLRKDAKFSTGEDITPSIVKKSLAYYADPETGAGVYVGFKNIKSIKTGDDTVTIELEHPDKAFLQWLAVPIAAIVPPSSLNKRTNNVIGAGPFKMTEYHPGISMTVVKNKYYYNASEVALDKIVIEFLPNDRARVNALLSGAVDLIGYVPWTDWDVLANTPGITVDGSQGPFQYVMFNVNHEPFDDPKVRRAIAYAVNRENSVAAAFQGHGEPLAGLPVPQDFPGHAPGEKLWGHNLQKAKELLAEAGYPNGFKAKLLTTSQYKFLLDLGLSVAADLKKIGIDTQIVAPDWATRIRLGRKGAYDIAASGSSGIITYPSYLLKYVAGPNSYNTTYGYNNPELTAALRATARATTKEGVAKAFNKVQAIWQKDVPLAILNTRSQGYAFNKHVHGFENLPGVLTFFSGYSLVDTWMCK